MGRLLLAHEQELREIRSALELDVLITSETVKAALTNAVKGGGRGQRVAAFRAFAEAVCAADLPGANRLCGATEDEILQFVLRFRPQFKEPKQGRPWKWCLALSHTSGSEELRQAVSELAAKGGREDCFLVRRPQVRLGKMALQLEEHIYPESAQRRAEKGKGKDKGGKNGKDGKGGKGGNKGGGKNGTGVVPPTAAGKGSASAASTGVQPPAPLPKEGEEKPDVEFGDDGPPVRATYTGREPDPLGKKSKS